MAGDPEIRASDAEREQVVRRLSAHMTAGRLTLTELEEHTQRAYTATTRADLDGLTADLPAMPEPQARGGRTPTRWLVGLIGGSTKRGRWRVGRRVNTISVIGGHDLDLRQAELEADEITIVSVSVIGGDDIYLPDFVDVEVSGFSLIGGSEERGSRRTPRRGAPRVRVLSFSLIGGSDIWRLPAEANELPLKEARALARRHE